MDYSLFQSAEWEKFKVATGYAASYRVDDILVLVKRLPLGRSMLYSPMVGESEKLKACPESVRGVKSEKFTAEIRALAKKTRAMFYRLELDIPANHNPRPSPLPERKRELGWTPSPCLQGEGWGEGFIKSFEEMQPEHTLILDLTKSKEEILAQMKQKGRYNIKIAERSGIAIKSSDTSGPELDAFYALYEMMAKRQKISYRDKKYFEALLEILGKKDYARVYSASIGSPPGSGGVRGGSQIDLPPLAPPNLGGEPLAAAIIVFYCQRATYLFGGSSDEHRNLMAPYGLHWQIIRDAKAAGCTEYDFFGIAPDDNPKHPWAGVTRFKKKFGGQEMHLAGSWDLVFRPVEYQAFKVLERLRR